MWLRINIMRCWVRRPQASHLLRPLLAHRSFGQSFSHTPVLLQFKIDMQKFEQMIASQEEKMDISLFEDPTGGLSMSEATEMTESELTRELTSSSNVYDPIVYWTVFSPMVDVASIVVRHGLLPLNNAEIAASRWFCDPRQLLTKPKALLELMGEERYAAYRIHFGEWLMDIEETAPLRRVARRYGVKEEMLIPFLRVVGEGLWSRNWETKQQRLQQLPGMALALSSGKGEKLIGFSDATKRSPVKRTADGRIHLVAELLIALGQETGNSSPAFLGIQLLRANNLDVPYRTQKALTNVFASIQRLKTDWELRGSGTLRATLPKWQSGYLKQVEKDAMKAAPSMFDVLEVTSVHPDGSHDLDELSTYFRREVNTEVQEMQRNIAKSVQTRIDLAKSDSTGKQATDAQSQAPSVEDKYEIV